MGDITTAAAIMLGLALFFAGILVLAYRFFRVDEDPRLEKVEDLLPGTNCGACGTPGCSAFAVTLLSGVNSPSGCTVASPEGVEALAEFLGVAAGDLDRSIARLHCAGGTAQARQIAEYEGYENCRGAALVTGGGKGCAWGCLGLGDCDVSCDFDAIHMSANGLPVVDVIKCTACGDCVDACPKDLFHLQPLSQPLLVQCSVPLAGDAALAHCIVACDACGRCAQDAPASIIEMAGNLPQVDPLRNAEAGPGPTFRCPTGAIQWLPGGQFLETATQNKEGHSHA